MSFDQNRSVALMQERYNLLKLRTALILSHGDVSQIVKYWKKFDKLMSNFVAIHVPADGLAPLGARPSAGTVMSRLYTVGHSKGYVDRINLLSENTWQKYVHIDMHGSYY